MWPPKREEEVEPLGKGVLHALFMAHCGTCTHPYGYGAQPIQLELATTWAEARRMLIEYGWHKTRKYGWVCNECWEEGRANG